jgi:hypothetical protein
MSFYYHYPYYNYQHKPLTNESFNKLTIKEQYQFVLGRLHYITSKYNLFNRHPIIFKLHHDYIYNHPNASDEDIIKYMLFIYNKYR